MKIDGNRRGSCSPTKDSLFNAFPRTLRIQLILSILILSISLSSLVVKLKTALTQGHHCSSNFTPSTLPEPSSPPAVRSLSLSLSATRAHFSTSFRGNPRKFDLLYGQKPSPPSAQIQRRSR